jgi:hypothetical protein
MACREDTHHDEGGGQDARKPDEDGAGLDLEAKALEEGGLGRGFRVGQALAHAPGQVPGRGLMPQAGEGLLQFAGS